MTLTSEKETFRSECFFTSFKIKTKVKGVSQRCALDFKLRKRNSPLFGLWSRYVLVSNFSLLTDEVLNRHQVCQVTSKPIKLARMHFSSVLASLDLPALTIDRLNRSTK